jgi:hypothetical protein
MLKADLKRMSSLTAIAAAFILSLLIPSCTQEDSGTQLWPSPRFDKSPYLIFRGDNTTMTVRWQMTGTVNATIKWGTIRGVYELGSIETTENSAEDGQHFHEYTITGLTPGTRYYYRVTSIDGVQSGSFVAAAPANALNLKFFAYGDSRTVDEIHDLVADSIWGMYHSDPSYRTFLLSMGDLVTNGDLETMWDDDFFNQSGTHFRQIIQSVPFISAAGNHDLGPSLNSPLFKKYFPYPYVAADGRYWSFDYGPAHVAILDGYVPFNTGSGQLTWLQADLAGSSKTWKFVVIHQPGWSANGGHANNTNVQDYIEPLCETYGVDIVFAGHNHYYARAVVSIGGVKTVQHITTGGGSGPLYTPATGQPNVVKTDMSNHYCAVEIAGNTLTFKAIRIDGTEIETFTINKP